MKVMATRMKGSASCVGEAHHDHVPEAPVVAGDQAHDDAQERAAQHRGEADQQRDLAADDDAGEHVAAQRVGAEGWAALAKGAVRRAARSMDSPPSGNSQPEASTRRIMTPVRQAPSTNSSER